MMNRLVTWKSLAATALIVATISSAAAVSTTRATNTDGSANNGSVQQNGTPVNSITVNGFGDASGTPDIAMVQLGVDVFDADPSKAIATANDTIDKVTKAIMEAGVAEADIQTQNFNLYSTGNPPDPTMGAGGESGPAAQRMYQAQISVSVKVRDIKKAGTVIDAGIKAGANNIYGLNFNIDDPSKLESEARVKAIANARARAEELAKALGVTLGDPIIISEGVNGGVPMPYAAGVAGMGGNANTKISEGQLAIAVSVQITYAISK
jgi:uncharacterized protein